ncbi:MAG: hypothetical protein NW223_24345 [Hyphomicrobiaceae bacterium]|nr:hypothetical protein [Hyphomicrobiaceae bacterium]
MGATRLDVIGRGGEEASHAAPEVGEMAEVRPDIRTLLPVR